MSDIFREAEDKNFRRWLEEEFYDEFVPVSRRHDYLNDNAYHNEIKLQVAIAMIYALKGVDKLRQFMSNPPNLNKEGGLGVRENKC